MNYPIGECDICGAPMQNDYVDDSGIAIGQSCPNEDDTEYHPDMKDVLLEAAALVKGDANCKELLEIVLEYVEEKGLDAEQAAFFEKWYGL